MRGSCHMTTHLRPGCDWPLSASALASVLLLFSVCRRDESEYAYVWVDMPLYALLVSSCGIFSNSEAWSRDTMGKVSCLSKRPRYVNIELPVSREPFTLHGGYVQLRVSWTASSTVLCMLRRRSLFKAQLATRIDGSRHQDIELISDSLI